MNYFRVKNFNVFGADIYTDESDENYFQFSGISSNFDHIFESNAFEICINCTGASNVLNSFNEQKIDFQIRKSKERSVIKSCNSK